jgi:hypothetical protein
MCYARAVMITETTAATTPVRRSGWSVAEAGRFELPMALLPNRISSPFTRLEVAIGGPRLTLSAQLGGGAARKAPVAAGARPQLCCATTVPPGRVPHWPPRTPCPRRRRREGQAVRLRSG